MIEFKPTRLMIKRHSLTGLKYFCKSTATDPLKYRGSGKYWVNHIRKYGVKHVVTDWVSEVFTDPADIEDFALLFSELHNIVDSTKWANKKPENGLDGGWPQDAETRRKQKERFNDPQWKETVGKDRTRKSLEGFMKTTSDPVWQDTIGKQMRENQSKAGKGKPKSEEHRRNLTLAQLANGGNGPEKHTEETKRKISLANTGKKRSDETRRKLSEANKGNKPWCTGIPQTIVTCPHCNKQGGDRNMKRYHFDNCKKKENK